MARRGAKSQRVGRDVISSGQTGAFGNGCWLGCFAFVGHRAENSVEGHAGQGQSQRQEQSTENAPCA